MATVDTVSRPHDRQSRRKPFSAFMKRLANLNKGSSESNSNGLPKGKKSGQKNNPYPESGWVGSAREDRRAASLSVHTPVSVPSLSERSNSHGRVSLSESREEHHNERVRSVAPTVSTKADTTHSDRQSKAGTVNTAAGALSSHGVGGEGSTFSSPAPSVRSLTTMTTVQSAAPANALNVTVVQPTNTASQPQQFSHQFPTSPASAIPSHLAGHSAVGHPTYNIATANNLLSDNASILTLASSSKRRRRNSLDTNASVKALAPSSIFGGSRESLPLSVLSATVPDSSLSAVQNRPAVGGTPAAERASVYSSSGVVPAIAADRSSYQPSRQATVGDGASIRSGLAYHGRNDSLTGSIKETASPLMSPRESTQTGKPGRSSLNGDADDEGERGGK